MTKEKQNETLEGVDVEGQGILKELVAFLMDNKKYWLLPIVLMLLLLGGFIILSSSSMAPFIYTLF